MAHKQHLLHCVAFTAWSFTSVQYELNLYMQCSLILVIKELKYCKSLCWENAAFHIQFVSLSGRIHKTAV
jgi:hypothetical protein